MGAVCEGGGWCTRSVVQLSGLLGCERDTVVRNETGVRVLGVGLCVFFEDVCCFKSL